MTDQPHANESKIPVYLTRPQYVEMAKLLQAIRYGGAQIMALGGHPDYDVLGGIHEDMLEQQAARELEDRKERIRIAEQDLRASDRRIDHATLDDQPSEATPEATAPAEATAEAPGETPEPPQAEAAEHQVVMQPRRPARRRRRRHAITPDPEPETSNPDPEPIQGNQDENPSSD